MVVYNFKKIQVVPTAKEFIDITLSKTQRKTPTIVHNGYKIGRIRGFYLRKVKYTQQNYHDKLSLIIEDFPKVDDIHPFYADLMNILYDKDHYKLALGQLNTARQLIDNVARDYTRMLKFGSSLYGCKQLKRAALGRMCTIMKKQASVLEYLEQVRQHLARLPSIDPNTRTLVVAGYPNVGKTSFVNKVSRVNAEVQDYAFTTRSLYVGHFDYQYLRWQVIDTPGILDHPLEERNTIEMQAITALAHLKAAILFIIDISGHSKYTIEQQVSLFNSIKPLFSDKPLIIVMNKVDIIRYEQLPESDQQLIKSLVTEGAHLLSMSNISDEGVHDVKQAACDKLLEQRVQTKLKGKKVNDILNKLQVAKPFARDNKERPPQIPDSVLVKKEGDMEIEDKKLLERDLEAANGGPGVYSADFRKYWLLSNPEWKYDKIPEIMDGKNIADFEDPEIMAKLDALEKEEEEFAAINPTDDMEEEESDLDSEEEAQLEQIREKKKLARMSNQENVGVNTSILPRRDGVKTEGEFVSTLESMGIDPTKAVERQRSNSRGRSRSRGRSDGEENDEHVGQKRKRSSLSENPRKEGLRNVRQKIEAETLKRDAQKNRNKQAKKGEGDRVILNMKPKHLFSGKRKSGTNDRR